MITSQRVRTSMVSALSLLSLAALDSLPARADEPVIGKCRTQELMSSSRGYDFEFAPGPNRAGAETIKVRIYLRKQAGNVLLRTLVLEPTPAEALDGAMMGSPHARGYRDRGTHGDQFAIVYAKTDDFRNPDGSYVAGLYLNTSVAKLPRSTQVQCAQLPGQE